MKLAMAVGDNRHWAVDEMMPRHFIQTAAQSGMGAIVVEEILDTLREKVEPAIEKTHQHYLLIFLNT